VTSSAGALVAAGFPVPALPGGADLVRGLCDRGMAVGLVTGSTRREVEATMGPLDLLPCFAVVVAADDYREGKPAPDCYRSALRALHADAARSVAVEDSWAGVAAGRAAGLRVVGTRAAHRKDQLGQDLSAADLIVPGLDHAGLLEWVDHVVSE
jgi:beta-phosphoglucomutase